MTLCIAALANDRTEPKIVLCSDQLLGDEYQKTEMEFKSDIGFSDTLAAMYSGPWEDYMNLKRTLKRKVDKIPLTLDNYRQVLSDEWKEFDAIFRGDGKETDAQCIVAGFLEGEPRIIRIQKDGVDTMPFCVAIGIGGYHADTILSWRKITQFTNLEWVLYYVYEAKKFGELCSDVGKHTIMEVLSLDAKGHFQIDLLRQSGFDILEEWFKRFRPQQMTHLDRLPNSAFHRVKYG